MHINDAKRILRNLDKIRHLAAGGTFAYSYTDESGVVHGKGYKHTRHMNLPYLDHYIIIPLKKPRYKLKLGPTYIRVQE